MGECGGTAVAVVEYTGEDDVTMDSLSAKLLDGNGDVFGRQGLYRISQNARTPRMIPPIPPPTAPPMMAFVLLFFELVAVSAPAVGVPDEDELV